MLSFFANRKLGHALLVLSALALLAAVPLFPGIRSSVPIQDRTRQVEMAVVQWLAANNLVATTKPMQFEVFYTDGVKEDAVYARRWDGRPGWEVRLNPASQQSYATPYAGGEGWGCPGTTVSDMVPTGSWSWQGACVGEDCVYGNPQFTVTGWSSSSGVLQSCA